jgi:hypothetical protein
VSSECEVIGKRRDRSPSEAATPALIRRSRSGWSAGSRTARGRAGSTIPPAARRDGRPSGSHRMEPSDSTAAGNTVQWGVRLPGLVMLSSSLALSDPKSPFDGPVGIAATPPWFTAPCPRWESRVLFSCCPFRRTHAWSRARCLRNRVAPPQSPSPARRRRAFARRSPPRELRSAVHAARNF